MKASTLVEIAQRHAEERGERRLYGFLTDGERASRQLTFGGLHRRATHLARRLRQHDLTGRPVLLALPPGLELPVALFACFYAGAIAVPVPPPGRGADRLQGIAADCGAAAALVLAGEGLTPEGLAPEGLASDGLAPELLRLEVPLVDGPGPGGEERDEAPQSVSEIEWGPPHPKTVALLQYTSGSTAEPRGVVVTHQNLLSNQRAIRRCFGSSDRDVVASWLPPHHDMGLIGTLLHPLFLGASAWLMSPTSFLRRPARWLRMISRHRATLSGAPNFAYRLCAESLSEEDKEGLDLSSWRVAFCGAEPVQAATLERFRRAFAGQGFSSRALLPCYGLAESTLLVSGVAHEEAPRILELDAAALEQQRVEAWSPGDSEAPAVSPPHERPERRRLVSCGPPDRRQQLLVVNPATGEPLGPGQVGELWLRGPSVAQGYWRRPSATAELFHALPAAGPTESPRGYLRTGDLGFLESGELFLTGRLKDLIILRGRNIHPQDVEEIAGAADPRLAVGAAAAFGVDREGRGEGLVVVQELDRGHRRMAQELQDGGSPELPRRLAEEVARGLGAAATVVLVPPASIPRTSSGKVRRGECRRRYLAGELTVLAQARRAPETGAAEDVGVGGAPESGSVEAGTFEAGTFEAGTFEAGTFEAEFVEAGPAEADLVKVGAGENGTLEARVDQVSRELETRLVAEVARRLGVDVAAVDPRRSLAAHGLDSLAAAQLEGWIEDTLDRDLRSFEALAADSIGELARRLAQTPKQRREAVSGGGEVELPLTAGQRALYFLQRLEPESTAYHLAVALEARPERAGEEGEPSSRLDLDRFGGALARWLIQRHETLGATFTAPGGVPRQRLGGTVVDWESWGDLDSGEAGEEELQRRLEAAARERFELEKGTPWRLRGWRRGGTVGWLLVVHHLVADLASMELLVEEVLRWTAAALAAGDPEPWLREPWSRLSLPAVRSWASEVRSRERWLRSEAARRELDFWRRRLTPPPQPLALPTDRPRRDGNGLGGRTFRTLSPDLVDRLEGAAAAWAVTPFAILTTAWEVLLARWSEQWSFALGTIAGEHRRPPDSAGYRVNPLVLRSVAAPGKPFSEVVEETSSEVLQALAHRRYPFQQVVDQLEVPRGNTRSPLFQALVGFQRPPGRRLAVGELLLGTDGGPFPWTVATSGEWAAETEVLESDPRRGPTASGRPSEGHRLQVRSLAVDPGGAQFDLSLLAAPVIDHRGEAAAAGQSRRAWMLRLERDADLFDATTAHRLLRQLETLLTAGLRQPASPVSRLPLLTAGERHQLRLESADTAVEWRGWRDGLGAVPRVPAWVARHARRQPGAVALRWFRGGGETEEQVSYGELWLRVQALAGLLSRRGAGAETVVATLLERGPRRVVALLAILQAGAAYLPLDPLGPARRWGDCLEDSAALLVLGEGPLPVDVPAHRYLDLEAWEAPYSATGIATEADEGGSVGGIDDAAAAYVLYTSGSTGRPKAVINTHGALLNRLLWMQRAFPLGTEDRVLHKTAATFDVSLWELLWPLLAGAQMVLAPPGSHRDSTRMAELMARQDITVAHFVPSMLAVWIDEPAVAHCRRLHWVIASGEALPRTLEQRCRMKLPRRAELHNLYGPTEAAIDVTAWRCGETLELEDEPVPIGRPIANLYLRLLDPRWWPVALGTTGELAIGGVGLARGYLGEPRRTAESFIPDGEAPVPGARLYLTGDLGLRRRDGAVVFLRRRDQQIKVRGQRLEPGEVENALLGHPAVAAAAVVWLQGSPSGGGRPLLRAAAGAPGEGTGGVPVADMSGMRRFTNRRQGVGQLVAYVEPAAGEDGLPGELEEQMRGYLAGRLPAYMVPAIFVPLPVLPRTASGKVDRRSLPPPPRRSSRRRPPSGPMTEAETALLEAWRRVLGVQDPGVDDDFFRLGGDSILSLRVRSELAALGWQVELEEIYRFTGARALAERLQRSPELEEGMPGMEPSSTLVPGPFELISEADRRRLPQGVEAAFPLASAQQGVLFHAQFEPSSPLYRNIFLCRLEGPAEPSLLRQAVAQCIQRHEMLRTGFDWATYSQPLQWVAREAPAKVEVLDFRSPAEQSPQWQVERFLEEEQRRPLDWLRPPLVRFFLLRLPRGEMMVALSFLDAVLDGWSAASLMTEVLLRYDRQLSASVPPELPPPAPFRAFIAAELEAEESPAREFWQRTLSGAAAQRLPRWYEASAAEGVEVLSLEVSEQRRAALEALGESAGGSLKHALLAAHGLALGRLGGTREVVTVVESNGRPGLPGAAATLGMHMNLLPLRLDLEGGGPRELVSRVWQTERDAWPHRRYPFAMLQGQWGKENLVDVVFNFTHFHVLERAQDLQSLRWKDAAGLDRTHFPLRADFNLHPVNGRLELSLTADQRRVGSAQLRSLRGFFDRALELLATGGEGPLDCRDLLSAAQRHQLTVESVGPAPVLPSVPVMTEILRVAAARPSAPAVRRAEERLTYGELVEGSGRLAARLRSMGLGPGSVVGLAVRRSLQLPVALLGVLRAGAAYLPLDPTYPRRRLEAMAADAGLTVVVTESGLLPEELLRGWTTVNLRSEAWSSSEAGRADEVQELGEFALENLAYILYTSGSAGAPKGVQVRHRSLSNLVTAMATVLPYGGDTVALTTLSFDISILELLAPLATGGCVWIADEEEVHDGHRLAELIRRVKPRWLQATPATWRMLLAAGWMPPTGLRILSGGEALPPDLAKELLATGDVWNLYGPTETTVWSSAQRVEEVEAPVAIGRPLAHTRFYVLDAHRRPVPTGVVGELFIGGEGLARGYLRRPGLTADRFVPDPWCTEDSPGDRLYRTGDLVRWDARGRLRFLGRRDRQVKLHGYRIELGEVASALEEHPEVAQAVVVLRSVVATEDGQGNELAEKRQELVAYVLPAGGSLVRPARLREYLHQRLPRFMVPRRVISVEEMPLTTSGKIDVQRLPAPRSRRPSARQLQAILNRVETLSEAQARQHLEATTTAVLGTAEQEDGENGE
ncbi:MAG: amino acid adenylation domain-containing protein [Acidobacteriota bacterium]|nr:amino acid adenylation domain-containing protein [Acidobacteriota bacterium]